MNKIGAWLLAISLLAFIILFIATQYGCTKAPVTPVVVKEEVPAVQQLVTVPDSYPFENDDFIDENNTIDIGTIL